MVSYRRIGILAFSLLICGSGMKAATFAAVSQSAVYSSTTGDVTFNIDFNQVPDFYTLDSFGRPANDFQVYVVGDPSLPYPTDFDSIVRGVEIHLGGGIPIRNGAPSSTDPNAGGWGSVRGTVPFTLVGTDLIFSVPLYTLSNHSTDGVFTYIFQTDSFGAETQYLPDQQSTVIPEPSASLVLAGLSLTGLLALRRRWSFHYHLI